MRFVSLKVELEKGLYKGYVDLSLTLVSRRNKIELN